MCNFTSHCLVDCGRVVCRARRAVVGGGGALLAGLDGAQFTLKPSTAIDPADQVRTVLLDFFLHSDHCFLEHFILLVMVILELLHLYFEFSNASGSSLPKSSLGGAILSLALCRRSVGGRLASRLWTWRNDPFLTGQRQGCLQGGGR